MSQYPGGAWSPQNSVGPPSPSDEASRRRRKGRNDGEWYDEHGFDPGSISEYTSQPASNIQGYSYDGQMGHPYESATGVLQSYSQDSAYMADGGSPDWVEVSPPVSRHSQYQTSDTSDSPYRSPKSSRKKEREETSSVHDRRPSTTTSTRPTGKKRDDRSTRPEYQHQSRTTDTEFVPVSGTEHMLASTPGLVSASGYAYNTDMPPASSGYAYDMTPVATAGTALPYVDATQSPTQSTRSTTSSQRTRTSKQPSSSKRPSGPDAGKTMSKLPRESRDPRDYLRGDVGTTKSTGTGILSNISTPPPPGAFIFRDSTIAGPGYATIYDEEDDSGPYPIETSSQKRSMEYQTQDTPGISQEFQDQEVANERSETQKEKLRLLKKDNDGLRSQKESQRLEIDKLQSSLDRKEKSISRMEESMKKNSETIKSLQTQLGELQNQRADSDRQIARTGQQQAQSQSSSTRQEDRYIRAERDSLALQLSTVNSESQAEIENLRAQVEHQREDISQMKTSAKEDKKTIQSLEIRLQDQSTDFKRQIATMNVPTASVRERQLENQLADRQKKFEDIRNENNSYRSSYEDLKTQSQKQSKELNGQLESQKTVISRLEATASQDKSMIQSLEKKLKEQTATSKRQATATTTQQSQLESQLAELNKEFEDMRSERDSQAARFEVFRNQSQNEISSLRTQLESQKTTISHAESEAKEDKSTIQELEKKLKEHIASSKKQVTMSSTRQREIEGQSAGWQKSFEEIQTERDNQTLNFGTIRLQLEKQVNELNTELRNSNDRETESARSQQNMQRQVSKLEIDLRKARSDLEIKATREIELENRLKRAESDSQFHQKEIEQLRTASTSSQDEKDKQIRTLQEQFHSQVQICDNLERQIQEVQSQALLQGKLASDATKQLESQLSKSQKALLSERKLKQDLENENSKLHDRINVNNNDYASLQTQAQEAASQATLEQTKWKEDLEKLGEKLFKTQSKLTFESKAKRDLEKENQNLQDKILVQRDDHAGFQRQLQDAKKLKEELERAEDQLQKAQENITSEKRAKRDLEKQNRTLQDSIAAHGSTYAGLEKQIQDAQSEASVYNKLKADHDKLRADLEQVENQLQNSQASLKSEKKAKRVLENQNRTFQDQIVAHGTSYAGLEKQFQDAQSEASLYNELKKDNDKLKADLEQLESQLRVISADLSEETKKKRNFQNENRALQDRLATIGNDYGTLQGQIQGAQSQKTSHNKLVEDHEQLKEVHDKLSETYSKLNENYGILNDNHSKLNHDHKKLKEELEKLEARFSRTRTKLASETQSKQDLEQQNRSLHDQMIAQTRGVENRTTANADLERQLREAQSQVALQHKLKLDIEHLESRLLNTETKLTSEKKLKRGAEKDLAALKDRMSMQARSTENQSTASAELERQLRQAVSETHAQKELNQSLERELQQVRMKNLSEGAGVSRGNEKIDEIKAQLSREIELKRELELDNTTLKEQLNSKSEANKDLKLQTDKARSDIVTQLKTNKGLLVQTQELEAKLSAEVEQREQALAQVASHVGSLQSLEHQVQRIQAKLASETRLKQGAEEQLRTVFSKSTSHRTSEDQLRKDVQLLRSQLAIEQSSKGAFETQIQDLNTAVDSERRSFNARIESLNTEVNNLKSNLRSQDASKDRLEGDIKALCSKLGLEKDSNDRLRTQLEEVRNILRTERKTFKARIEQLTTEVGSLDSKLRSLEETNEALEDELSLLRAQSSQSRGRAENANVNIGHMQAKLKLLQKEVEHLSESLKRSEAFSADLRRQHQGILANRDEEVNNLRSDLNTAVEGQRETYHLLQMKDDELAYKSTDLEKLRGDCAALTEKVERKAREVARLQRIPTAKSNDIVVTLQGQLAEKNKEVEELVGMLHAQEENILKAQRAVFERSEHEKIKHSYLDDVQVAEKLKCEVFGSLEGWVRKYIRKRTAAEKAAEDTAPLANTLTHIGGVVEATALAEKFTVVFAEGLLSNLVAQGILKHPFFILSDPEHQGIANALLNIYESFMEVNVTEGQNWRFQTLQLLAQMRENPPARGYYANDKLAALQLQSCESFARQFIEGPAGAFLGPCVNEQERLQSLVITLKNISDVAFSLWTQRVFLRVRGYESLKDTLFNQGSPHVEAHKVHRLVRAPNSRNGEPISLVVQPEIVAYGNEEGKDYEKEKIWAKAVVTLRV